MDVRAKIVFKYISCYSLSLFDGYSYDDISHSNTSHVILYHNQRACILSIKIKFKYISCYSLSAFSAFPSASVSNSNTSHVILYRVDGIKDVDIPKFKYISCYSLSVLGCHLLFHIHRFKYISCYSLS